MNPFRSIPPDPTIEQLTAKAATARDALRSRYEAELTAAELEYLLARFVLGLTTPFYGTAEPALHLLNCKIILSRLLSPPAAARTLENVPRSSKGWFSEASSSSEQIGLRAGQLLFAKRNAPGEPISSTHSPEKLLIAAQ